MENRANGKVLDEGRGWTAFSLHPFQIEQHAFSVDTVKMRVTDPSFFFTILVYIVLFPSDSPGILRDLFSELSSQLQGNSSTQNRSAIEDKSFPGGISGKEPACQEG